MGFHRGGRGIIYVSSQTRLKRVSAPANSPFFDTETRTSAAGGTEAFSGRI